MKERSEYKVANAVWMGKVTQLEEANKKLIKSSFTMQDLEKENGDK